MRTQHPLDKFIQLEHKRITEKFNSLLAAALVTKKWGDLLYFCKVSIEENHHQKEEKFIFAAIAEHPALRAGGPLCGYYFDFHINNSSLRTAMASVLAATQVAPHPIWSEQMRAYRDKNLPLAVPGEDHEASRILLRAVSELAAEPEVSHLKISELMYTYQKLQTLHFEKEENCFVKMCMHLAPTETWEQVLSDMRLRYPDI